MSIFRSWATIGLRPATDPCRHRRRGRRPPRRSRASRSGRFRPTRSLSTREWPSNIFCVFLRPVPASPQYSPPLVCLLSRSQSRAFSFDDSVVFAEPGPLQRLRLQRRRQPPRPRLSPLAPTRIPALRLLFRPIPAITARPLSTPPDRPDRPRDRSHLGHQKTGRRRTPRRLLNRRPPADPAFIP